MHTTALFFTVQNQTQAIQCAYYSGLNTDYYLDKEQFLPIDCLFQHEQQEYVDLPLHFRN